MLWDAKASLISNKSTSLICQPVFFKAELVAGIGPRPIKDGSTPHVAHEAIFTKGSIFLSSASSLLIKTKAAAPSFNPEEFPAVTVPLSLKTVFKEFKPSMLKFFLGYSSSLKISILSFFFISKVINSSLNLF